MIKLQEILNSLLAQQKTLRELKVNSKSSTKSSLTKIEKHVSLSVQLVKELLEKLPKERKAALDELTTLSQEMGLE